jgi:hypothetical protein
LKPKTKLDGENGKDTNQNTEFEKPDDLHMHSAEPFKTEGKLNIDDDHVM